MKKIGVVEGRYPALYVSYKIAEAVCDKVGYVRNKGLDEKILKELIISALQNGLLKNKYICSCKTFVSGSAVHAEWFLL